MVSAVSTGRIASRVRICAIRFRPIPSSPNILKMRTRSRLTALELPDLIAHLLLSGTGYPVFTHLRRALVASAMNRANSPNRIPTPIEMRLPPQYDE